MSQAPEWVPLVVAGFGIFGTLAAALCTQLLQERRERRQKEESRKALASERWLNHRQQLYAEFLGAMEPWVRWARTLRYSSRNVPRDMIDPGIPDQESFVETVQLLLARMELVGGQEVIAAARGFWLWTGAASVALAEANRTESNRDEFMRGLRESYAECVSAMRRDLDIPVTGIIPGDHPAATEISPAVTKEKRSKIASTSEYIAFRNVMTGESAEVNIRPGETVWEAAARSNLLAPGSLFSVREKSGQVVDDKPATRFANEMLSIGFPGDGIVGG